MLRAVIIQHNWLKIQEPLCTSGNGKVTVLQKNYGNELAKNDWILSLDGDEVITNGFIASLRDMDLKDEVVYEIDIQTFYYGKALRHSGFYPLWKKRLFNKRYFSWNAAAVHEGLEGKIMHSTKRIVGKVHHYSFKDKLQYEEKMDNYARLGALRWIDEGRKPGKMKYLFGPAFRFVKAYILNLGILDGRAGYEIALMDMRTNRKKLNYFRQLSTTHH